VLLHSSSRLEPGVVFHRYPTDLQLDARRASQIVMACREGSNKGTIDGYLLLRMSRATLPQSGHGTAADQPAEMMTQTGQE